jgi:hypothetical protein
MKTLLAYLLAPVWIPMLFMAMATFSFAAAVWFFFFALIGIFGALARGYYD